MVFFPLTIEYSKCGPAAMVAGIDSKKGKSELMFFDQYIISK